MWLRADDAFNRLGVKPQTLYASVSRGRIKAKPDPADPRRSLYNSDDVDRLARRGAGRPRLEMVAAEAISWGDPMLPSAISTVEAGRLYYRGVDAVAYSQSATLEEAVGLLWGGFSPAFSAPSNARGSSPIARGLVALAEQVATAPPSLHRPPLALREDASRVFGGLADAMLGPGTGPLHERLAILFDRPDAADDLRCALVLLADHELNASTFAARVAVSTGASLAAGALAGLATLTGPRHGQASSAVAVLAEEFEQPAPDASEILRDWLGEGRIVPGFGHRLYPLGDPRAAALLGRLRLPPAYVRLRDAAEIVVGEPPNVDFALAALAEVHDLPKSAPLTIFAMARAAGWLAHMLEQAETGALIRPRARYIGVKPTVT
ncbi:MAG: citrate synthase [Devosia sp.]